METTQQVMPPEGFLQNVQVDFPCFQKYDLRIESNGRKFCVYQLSWYPSGQSYDQLYSFHFSEEEARAEHTKQECERDGKPLPPGRYLRAYFNGKKAEGLAESSAQIYARKNKAFYVEQGLVAEVVPDKYNPRKFAVRGMQVVS